jgi:hypothetical protein
MIRAARAVLAPPDLVVPLAGAFLTTLACLAAVRVGPLFVISVLAALLFFSATVLAYFAMPHVAVAITIPLFAALPTIKQLALPWIGPLKDGVVVAAVVAAVLVTMRRSFTGESHPVDRWVLTPVVLLMTLYFVNLGGGMEAGAYDAGWIQGVRLAYEPLLLLLVGLSLDAPRRTIRWAVPSIVGTCAVIGVYGVVQQLLGHARLREMGYEYDVQIRFFEGLTRSFGTLDDPFAYAAFLLFGLGVVLAWPRPHPAFVTAGLAICAGLAVSYVRTAAIIAVAILGVWLFSRHRVGAAVAFLLSAVMVSLIILFTTEGATESRTVVGSPGYVTLNGRTESWTVAVGDTPTEILFGKGVGETGTAAYRARYSVTQSSEDADRYSLAAVDSGYFQTIADIGFVGLAVLLALFGRLFGLAIIAARRGVYEGWAAAGLMTVIMLDATTRDSFSGFPTAFVGMLMVGVVLAAAREKLLALEPSGGGRGDDERA